MPWPGPGSENEKANITEEEVKDDDAKFKEEEVKEEDVQEE